MKMAEWNADAVETDIDSRLSVMWAMIWSGTRLGEVMDQDEILSDQVARTMRYAYTRGYWDALHEERGRLFTDHGFTI